MKRKVHVRVAGRFDNTDGATVTIDRNAGLISVRPLRRHREFTLPLADVARHIVYSVVMAELSEKRRGKRRLVKRGLR